jgi:hypothetical protein
MRFRADAAIGVYGAGSAASICPLQQRLILSRLHIKMVFVAGVFENLL